LLLVQEVVLGLTERFRLYANDMEVSAFVKLFVLLKKKMIVFHLIPFTTFCFIMGL